MIVHIYSNGTSFLFISFLLTYEEIEGHHHINHRGGSRAYVGVGWGPADVVVGLGPSTAGSCCGAGGAVCTSTVLFLCEVLRALVLRLFKTMMATMTTVTPPVTPTAIAMMRSDWLSVTGVVVVVTGQSC